MAVTFDAELYIEAPPETVFDLMLSPDRFGEWMENFERVEILDAGGPDRTGARWRETRKLLGREATEEFEVVSAERPNAITLRIDGSKGSSGKGEYVFRYRIEPEREGSRVYFDAAIDIPGFMAKVMGRLMAGPMKKMTVRDMQCFAGFAEREAKSG